MTTTTSTTSTTTTTKNCYFPSGNLIDSKAENVVPCNPTSTGHSACCPADAVCLTNGLCFQQDSWGNRVARSGCTDEGWEDGSCAGVCEDVFPNVPISIYLSEPDSANGNFCCGGMYNGTSCPHPTKGSYEPFTMEKGMVLFPNTSLTLSQYAVSMQQAAVEENNNNDTTVASGGSGSGDAVLNQNGTGTGVSDGESTATASLSTSTSFFATNTSAEGGKLVNTTTPTIALGISLGLPLLILTSLLIWQWRRARLLQKELSELKQLQSSPSSFSTTHPVAMSGAVAGWGDSSEGYSTLGGWGAGETIPFARAEILGEEVGRGPKELPGGGRRGELQG